MIKNYFTTHNTRQTPRFFFVIWNVVILNYNKYSRLTITQKIKEALNTRRSEARNVWVFWNKKNPIETGAAP